MLTRTLLLLPLLMTAALPAAAQNDDDGVGDGPPRVALTAAAGIALPYHGDFDFNPAAWQGAARVAVARHFLVEGFYGQWRHSSERVIENQVITGPGGVTGRIDRITLRTEQVRPTLGINALLTGAAGRVRFSVGGGVGASMYERRFTQSYEGCAAPAGSCLDFTNRHASSGFSVQGVAGVDVAVTRRFGIVAELRAAGPVEDPGFGESTVLGGLRVTVW